MKDETQAKIEKTLDKVETRLEKIGTHFRKNKVTYLACGGTAVVAVVGTIVVLAKNDRLTIGDQNINQILSWKPEAHQTLEVYIEALGDPGNIIQDETTGIVYASQNQIARALGVHPVYVSQHLHGKRNHVNGHKLTKLGKAMVSET